MLNWILGIAPALAETADAAGDMNAVGSMISSLVMMVGLFAVMYFIMIRPQRKKDKKVKEMLSNLKVTDRVTTIGGIHGTIVGIKDDNVVITVGKDNVQLVFARWAIRNVAEETLENETEALN